MNSRIMKRVFNRNFTTLFFISVLLPILFLTGCGSGPKFSVYNFDNHLRGTQVCQMQNNFIKNKNVRCSLSFDFWKNTECKPPFGLTVSISAVNYSPSFRENSIAHLHLVTNGQAETLKIVSWTADHDAEEYISSTPGHFIDGFYFPGSIYSTVYEFSTVHFPLTKKQMKKIVCADEMHFEIETTGFKTVCGTLSPENINNIKQFAMQCCLD